LKEFPFPGVEELVLLLNTSNGGQWGRSIPAVSYAAESIETPLVFVLSSVFNIFSGVTGFART
jgi:hypothetical protein